MDEITMTLPMYFQLFSLSILCAFGVLGLVILAWLFVAGATKKETPRPKGFDND